MISLMPALGKNKDTIQKTIKSKKELGQSSSGTMPA
jgi:hypothetical protein